MSQGKFLPIGQVAIVVAKNAKVVGCRKIYGKQSDKLVRQIPIRRSVAILFSVALRCNFATGCNPYQNMRYNSKIDKFRQKLVDFTFSLFTLHFSLFSF